MPKKLKLNELSINSFKTCETNIKGGQTLLCGTRRETLEGNCLTIADGCAKTFNQFECNKTLICPTGP